MKKTATAILTATAVVLTPLPANAAVAGNEVAYNQCDSSRGLIVIDYDRGQDIVSRCHNSSGTPVSWSDVDEVWFRDDMCYRFLDSDGHWSGILSGPAKIKLGEYSIRVEVESKTSTGYCSKLPFTD